MQSALLTDLALCVNRYRLVRLLSPGPHASGKVFQRGPRVDETEPDDARERIDRKFGDDAADKIWPVSSDGTENRRKGLPFSCPIEGCVGLAIAAGENQRPPVTASSAVRVLHKKTHPANRPELWRDRRAVKETRVFFTVTLVEQLDCKKSTSILCDGFLYFRSEGGWKDADRVCAGFNDRAES